MGEVINPLSETDNAERASFPDVDEVIFGHVISPNAEWEFMD
jgi:hypothetical protein